MSKDCFFKLIHKICINDILQNSIKLVLERIYIVNILGEAICQYIYGIV
ncbi:Predicted protein (fragment) [Listeria monocytogenes]